MPVPRRYRTEVIVHNSKEELAEQVAVEGADLIRRTLAEKGAANIVLATGTSQFGVLEALVKAPDLAWERVTGFHLDEYVGLPATHPASFRAYLRKHFVRHVSVEEFYYINGEGDVESECHRLSEVIAGRSIDVTFLGIGENGHLAFNDPPADFETERPFILVELSGSCRNQQVREGWFERLEDVPTRAISMSIRQIMKSKTLLCACPDARKAQAVKACLEGPVTPFVPGSILQRHASARIHLDREAASLLERKKTRDWETRTGVSGLQKTARRKEKRT